MLRCWPVRMLVSAAIALGVVFSLAPAAEAASPYVRCIQKTQKKHKTVARVVPLEGISKGLSLDNRIDTSVFTDGQSTALTAAFDEILKCREKALKRASKYPDVLAIMNNVFGNFDLVYVDLQQRKLPIGMASVLLVNLRNDAEVKIKRIESGISARDAEQARKNSADGWRLMQQGLDILYPPETPPKSDPSYTCRDYGGYTRCTPD